MSDRTIQERWRERDDDSDTRDLCGLGDEAIAHIDELEAEVAALKQSSIDNAIETGLEFRNAALVEAAKVARKEGRRLQAHYTRLFNEAREKHPGCSCDNFQGIAQNSGCKQAAQAILARQDQPPPDVEGWRDIETAPRVGSTVLVFRPLARNSNDEPIAVKRLTFTNNYCWEHTVPDGETPTNPTDGLCHVTHWQPLPSAPSSDTPTCTDCSMPKGEHDGNCSPLPSSDEGDG